LIALLLANLSLSLDVVLLCRDNYQPRERSPSCFRVSGGRTVSLHTDCYRSANWLQRQDLNLRSPAYETGENVLASLLCYFGGITPVMIYASSVLARVITSGMVYISGTNSL
jgi:hypothetical protein